MHGSQSEAETSGAMRPAAADAVRRRRERGDGVGEKRAKRTGFVANEARNKTTKPVWVEGMNRWTKKRPTEWDGGGKRNPFVLFK
jgi:hypothetical protein